MPGHKFFFEREEFHPDEIRKPYYTYLGYVLEAEKNDDGRIERRYPVFLYFGKDEIAIYYRTDRDEIIKIFSLYVAEGLMNQAMLSKKIEDYAQMPLWPSSKKILKDEMERLRVDPVLLQSGFFSSYYGFEFDGEKAFSKLNLPGSRSDAIEVRSRRELLFRYRLGRETESRDIHENPGEDNWSIEADNKIRAKRINFSKLLLDFLFELDFTNTFEDENFFELQPHLQNNLVLDALTKKCRYLSELHKQKTFVQKKNKQRLPKSFRDAEKEWLNVCRLKTFEPVFASPKSLFKDAEEEVKHVVFEARIGEGRKKRLAYMKAREDAELKNNLCAFFMRKYSIWRAFRVLFPPWGIPLFFLILLAIPLGDLFLPDNLVGTFSVALPLGILCFILLYQWLKGINLFKLVLPRLFLGIMIGWAVFWGSEELWKKALTTEPRMVLIFDIFLFIVISMYVFTDIGNQMQLKHDRRDRRILVKTLSLMLLALTISFVMGFYTLQFYANPLLNNSGFLSNKRLYKPEVQHPENFDPNLDELFTKNKYAGELRDNIRFLIPSFKVENYRAKGKFDGLKLRYIWSILFSQFVMAILIGVVLQLIWEDRPITEPL